MTLVDQLAAFDMCSHHIILEKLELLAVLNLDWVASYQSGRTQSNLRILSFLGWLNGRQLYMVCLLPLTHRIVQSGKQTNLSRSIVSAYSYKTWSAAGQELRAWATTVRARDRTAYTARTFKV